MGIIIILSTSQINDSYKFWMCTYSRCSVLASVSLPSWDEIWLEFSSGAEGFPAGLPPGPSGRGEGPPCQVRGGLFSPMPGAGEWPWARPPQVEAIRQ